MSTWDSKHAHLKTRTKAKPNQASPQDSRAYFLTSLKSEHARVMQRLYRQLAVNRQLASFDTLDDRRKFQLIADARTLCRTWEMDATRRDSHQPGVDTALDLVAEQYHLARQIAEEIMKAEQVR